ncbi:GNAT family N-acetyltransferase [Azospirillum sp.]|uniref:GNAT family N-acetyltransferase n=1 Tax=Azospirillum sp. TaxID=34012 RepID=UPI002D29B7C9|nr:GNAT family N-acetyltransferase [Azospirillum sp.]HYD68237.1 GNAT family N-acetyltransferase [Azospirillum sp.]
MPDQPPSSPYRSPAYAHALAALGPVLPVAPWGTGVLVRPIPGSGRQDAAGFYPLASIAPDADLPTGLAALRTEGLVSVVGVRDPFDGPPLDRFIAAFDVCRPFKTHFVIDRALGPPRCSDHHDAEVRRAQRRCSVSIVQLADHLDDWQRLYDGLIARHRIAGTARFSPEHFARLATLDTLTAFAAFADGRIVAMALWLRGGDVAYNHLGASDAEGYRRAVSYALYDAAIRHFADCRILDLGGNAGPADADDGLSRFKRGFANATATAQLFGAVLDRPAYMALCAGKPETAYFPVYRAPDSQRGGTGSDPATGSR